MSLAQPMNKMYHFSKKNHIERQLYYFYNNIPGIVPETRRDNGATGAL